MDRTRRSGHNPITEMLNRLAARQPIDRSKEEHKSSATQIGKPATVAAYCDKRAPAQLEPKKQAP